MLTRLAPTDMDMLHRCIVNHLQWPFDAGPERLRFLTLALCGETGELANLVKKEWRGDDLDKDAWTAKVKSEVADIGNYTFMIGEALGLDVPQLMMAKLIEVEQRSTWKGGPKS